MVRGRRHRQRRRRWRRLCMATPVHTRSSSSSRRRSNCPLARARPRPAPACYTARRSNLYYTVLVPMLVPDICVSCPIIHRSRPRSYTTRLYIEALPSYKVHTQQRIRKLYTYHRHLPYYTFPALRTAHISQSADAINQSSLCPSGRTAQIGEHSHLAQLQLRLPRSPVISLVCRYVRCRPANSPCPAHYLQTRACSTPVGHHVVL